MPRKHNKQNKLHIRKGDMVRVLSGNDKGKEGKVLRVFPEKERVIIEGVNVSSVIHVRISSTLREVVSSRRCPSTHQT